VKRSLAVAILVLVPLLGFADLQVGPTAMFAGTLESATQPSPSAVNFPFGVEARYKFLYLFQYTVTALFCADPDPSFVILTDLGITVRLDRFTLSGGIGPDFAYSTTSAAPADSSLINFKLSVDYDLGPLTVGIVAYDPVSALSQLRTNLPWFGLTAMFTLF
jgi:hypothetical protein